MSTWIWFDMYKKRQQTRANPSTGIPLCLHTVPTTANQCSELALRTNKADFTATCRTRLAHPKTQDPFLSNINRIASSVM